MRWEKREEINWVLLKKEDFEWPLSQIREKFRLRDTFTNHRQKRLREAPPRLTFEGRSSLAIDCTMRFSVAFWIIQIDVRVHQRTYGILVTPKHLISAQIGCVSSSNLSRLNPKTSSVSFCDRTTLACERTLRRFYHFSNSFVRKNGLRTRQDSKVPPENVAQNRPANFRRTQELWGHRILSSHRSEPAIFVSALSAAQSNTPSRYFGHQPHQKMEPEGWPGRKQENKQAQGKIQRLSKHREKLDCWRKRRRENRRKKSSISKSVVKWEGC